MDNSSTQQNICEISDAMKGFSLETANIASIQSDLCAVKEENKFLIDKVGLLESENAVIKNLNKTIIERLYKLETDMIAVKSSPAFAGQVADSVKEPNLGQAGLSAAEESTIIQKKPKAQRKTEQEQIYKNFRATMVAKNIQEKLWASGFLKMTVEQWEGNAGCMNSNEFCDFVKKSIDKFLTFTSSAESEERLILTLLKLCADRKVPKEKLKEILDCFAKRKTITEADVVKFLNLYANEQR